MLILILYKCLVVIFGFFGGLKYCSGSNCLYSEGMGVDCLYTNSLGITRRRILLPVQNIWVRTISMQAIHRQTVGDQTVGGDRTPAPPHHQPGGDQPPSCAHTYAGSVKDPYKH